MALALNNLQRNQTLNNLQRNQTKKWEFIIGIEFIYKIELGIILKGQL